jgi:C-terminal processing protease CtpA/Prc
VREVVIGRRYATEPLGIEIGGGFGSGVPIFIALVDEHGPAADKLRIGQRIITINGASSERVSHNEFAQMLRASPQNVNLEVA